MENPPSPTMDAAAAAAVVLPPPPPVPDRPSMKFSLATRPGKGVNGTRVSLLANHYRVRFQNKELYHYDVNIDPEPPKGCSYDVVREAFQKQADALNNAIPAYDGHKSLYTARHLGNVVELEVVLSDGQGGDLRRRGGKYHVVFRQANRINLRNLAQYLAGDPVLLPQEALQVMDVVLRQSAFKCFVAKGKSFFGEHFGVEKLQGGLVAYRGFFQSIRPAQDNLLTLNLGTAIPEL